MRKKIYFCESCNDTGQNLKDLTTSHFSENQLSFYKGYIDEQEITDGNTTVCPFCKNEIIMAEISGQDYTMLAKVSNFNRQLLDAMVDLHKKDVIEYELKMSQFRNQYEQSQRVEKQEQESYNIPKCPACQSTNLSKISTTKKVAKIAAFGIFGMGDNGKTWKCNNCGSKF